MEAFLENLTHAVESSEVQHSLLTAEHYKVIFDNLSIAITVTDADDNIVIWNKFTETLLDMDYNDLFHKSVKELYPEAEWQKIRAENIRQKGVLQHLETKIITKNQDIIDVDLAVRILHDKDGNIQGSIGIIRDISESKRSEHALQESMELSRGMIETAATAIFRLKEGRFAFVNPVMEDVTGYTSEELLSMDRIDLIHPAYREQAQEYIRNISAGSLNAPNEFRIIRKDLETTWVSERLAVIASKDREQIMGNWMDITEWKIAEEVSKYHSRQTELLLKVGSTAGQTLNLRDIIENFLDSINQMLEDRPVAFFLLPADSDSLELISHRGFSDDFAKRMSRIKLGKGFIGRVAITGLSLVLSPTYYDPRFDPAILERDNLWSLCSVPVFARDQIKGVICVGSRDQRHSLEEETQLFELIASQIGIAIDHALLYEKTVEMAFTDGLTGLYNRRYLFEEFTRELSRANRNQTRFSIISMDMDNLKAVNDRYGHNYGDLLIKAFGEIIKKISRKTDIGARMGGDEFVLLLPECDYLQADTIAQRILTDANSRKLAVKTDTVNISVSIGIAGYPAHGNTMEDILNRADNAMYEAKKSGKNKIVIAKSET